jgi:hypothetical protein
MINYKNIEQKSLEWFELKWGKIGGTLSKGLFVKSDTLLIDIMSQLIEDFEPSETFSNDAIDRGNEYEPFAREYLEKFLNVKFEESGWLQCEKNKLLGISPDGITADEEEACEIKCLGRKAHMEIIYEKIMPLKHTPQCIHYFTVNPKLKKLHFFCYRPESIKNYYKLLTLDSVINIGTNAKPKMVRISDAVEISRKNADELLKNIEEEIELLKF